MLSKNTLKFIKSLHQKKFRKKENAFFVEGSKNVTELLLSDFGISHLLYTEKFLADHNNALTGYNGESHLVSPSLLESLGSFQSNDSALAVAGIKPNIPPFIQEKELVIALDDVRDPGNLGTIIRIADWYGIKNILLSPESADFYNPKVLQASMGSFTRINVFYTDLKTYFQKADKPILGAFLDGKNIHEEKFYPSGILLMGNESMGISKSLEAFITHKITIPRFGQAESLNVAVATAIICDNLRRK